MNIPTRCTLLFSLVIFGSFNSGPASKADRLYVSQFENVLGTSMEIKTVAPSEAAAGRAEEAALQEIRRLNSLLSGYDPNSEFSRWTETQNLAVSVSEDLFRVLQLYDDWRVRSHGALNAAAEDLSRIWKKAEQAQEMPEKEEIRRSVSDIQKPHWMLDTKNRTAIHLDNVPLRFNSFTKSYIIDKAANAALAVPGIDGLVLNIGGDIVIRGNHEETVDIANPRADAENDPPLTRVSLRNLAIASSGDYRRGFQIGTSRYSHIFNLSTGQPASEIISSTVVAPLATDAGALATLFNILPPQESLQIVSGLKGVECLLVGRNGQEYQSDGWRSIQHIDKKGEKVNRTAAEPSAPNSRDWDPDFEMLVSIGLTRFNGMTRRPYVAIWIEDGDRKPVRTLALWYHKSRWLPDLRMWYRNNYRQLVAGSGDAASVSSATRPPGRYTLRWDGKNSNGQYVKEGTYTVYIEAAREHGTYQIIRQDIKCKGKAQQINCVGNVEIESASISYGRKTTQP